MVGLLLGSSASGAQGEPPLGSAQHKAAFLGRSVPVVL